MKSKPKKLKPATVHFEFKALKYKDFIYIGLVFGAFFIILNYSIIHFVEQRPVYVDIAANLEKIEAIRYDLITLGTSSSREVFLTEQQLKKKFKKISNKEFNFLDLSHSAQTFVESNEYLDKLNLYENQRFILSISPMQFARNSNRNAFNDDSLGDNKKLSFFNRITNSTELRKLRHFLYTSIKNVFINMAYNIYGLENVTTRYKYAHNKAGKKEKIESSRQRKAKIYIKNFNKNKQGNIDFLKSLIKRIHVNKSSIILLEQPHIANDTIYNYYKSDYLSIIHSIQNELNIEYIDFNKSTKLNQNDFVDVSHVSASGREKWSRTFLNWLAKQESEKLD